MRTGIFFNWTFSFQNIYSFTNAYYLQQCFSNCGSRNKLAWQIRY